MVKHNNQSLPCIKEACPRPGAEQVQGGERGVLLRKKKLHLRGLGASGRARGMGGSAPVLTGCMTKGADWWLVLNLLLL